MQYGGIVKICQVGHILSFLVFRGIDLCQLIFLEIFRLVLYCLGRIACMATTFVGIRRE